MDGDELLTRRSSNPLSASSAQLFLHGRGELEGRRSFEESNVQFERERGDVSVQARSSLREPNPKEEALIEAINEASKSNWVADWPQDRSSQVEILRSCIGKEMAEWPRFNRNIEKQVKSAAEEARLPIDDAAFVSKTTLTSTTYAPKRDAAKNGLKYSTKRTNETKLVGILHDKDDVFKHPVYARFGLDHGGELDIYGLKRGTYIGHGDRDTGVIFPGSMIFTDRFLIK